MPEPLVTVAIPVLDGMTWLEQVVSAVRGQQFDAGVELLVVDSSSTDGSWEWLSRQPGLDCVQIPRERFSHGGTRQEMAQRARGEFVAFLSQDAVPASHLWLAELIRPFFMMAEVAAVVGRQTPRPDAPAVIRRDIEISFANLGNPYAVSIYTNSPTLQAVFGRQPLAFISDVNAAYRRRVLTQEVPFPTVSYAEDQAIARALLDAGYAVAYQPLAEVIHSNDITLASFRHRITDEAKGLHEALGVAPPQDRVLGRSLLRAVAGGMAYALRDPSVGPAKRALGAAAIPAYEVRRRQGWADARAEAGNGS